MIVGLDLDNTIVCYDDAYEKLAEQFGVPGEVARNKQAVKHFFVSTGLESKWTEFQGELYGAGMQYAKPFPGCTEFLSEANGLALEVYIISHRSKVPYAGPRYDLHSSAREWLSSFSAFTTILDSSVFFAESKSEKVELIRTLNCQIFLDDLPEILMFPSFPSSCLRVLFNPDPINSEEKNTSLKHIKTWSQFSEIVREQIGVL